MSPKRKPTDSEVIRQELAKLLDGFGEKQSRGDIRERVLALVPVCRSLAKLGKSTLPKDAGRSARDRILYYLREYPRTAIGREELTIVAGIQEWARRVRELRVESGWSIITGATAKEMQEQGEFALPGVDVDGMRGDDYILLEDEPDSEAAQRWALAHGIRSKELAVRDKILEFLRAYIGSPVTGEELRYVARDKTEWARRVRELRSELGWPVVTRQTGRPDLPVGTYVLEADRQSPKEDRSISDKLRGEVLQRDKYACQECGWTHDLWNRSDPRHLELHHVKPHGAGGKTEEANLATLCTVCHDDVHRRRADAS